jgi:hypothetical protein
MTMALKPSQISRRNFVQRAGLLVSALGVGASVQAGLMDSILKKANKKWGAEALAASTATTAFHIEISFRAGFQMNSLFPGLGHSQPNPNEALNFYSSPGNVIPILTATNSANPFFIASYGPTVGTIATTGAGALGTYIKTNAPTMGYGAASSEAITLIDGQHTANFLQRAPSSTAPCPAVLHAALGPSCPINGVEWNSNGAAVTNQTGAFPALNAVTSQADFFGLYKDLPMYFHADEMALIAGTFDAASGLLTKNGAIDSMDAMFETKNVPGAGSVAAVSLAGRNQAQLNILTALQTKYAALIGTGTTPTAASPFAGLASTAGAAILKPNASSDADSGIDLPVALASGIAAMQLGALSTLHISLDSADWHGDISALDDATGKQGAWNLYLGQCLQSALMALDNNTSTITGPTAKMSSSFLISMNSEFTRTPNRNGGGVGDDDGDGGSAAFFFVGSKVNSGTYGNITPAGALQSFNPATGAMDTSGSFSVNEANLWMAHGQLLGVPMSNLQSLLPATASIPALVKA